MDLIKKRQEEIIEEFSMLDGDMEMTLNYIMELGEELGDMPEADKVEENIVKGCQSKVWMTARMDQDRIQYRADSNTAITKGLVSLLVRVLNQSSPESIIKAEIYFPKQIGMDRFIGTQRSNGFAAMIQQMKRYAIAFSAKANQS
ncbi:MAG: SufE family protein [Ekhidna sp.]